MIEATAENPKWIHFGAGNIFRAFPAALSQSLLEKGLEKTGITLALEPLNTIIDHKGYYLWQSSEAFEIINKVNSPHVKILYDIYHQQVMEGNIVNTITSNIEKICHFHSAGLPGRGELHDGELNYPFIFSKIDKAGYKGYIGLEYFPKQEPLENLSRIIHSAN